MILGLGGHEIPGGIVSALPGIQRVNELETLVSLHIYGPVFDICYHMLYNALLYS